MASHAEQIAALIAQADGLLVKYQGLAEAHAHDVDQMVAALREFEIALTKSTTLVKSALSVSQSRQIRSRIEDAAARCRTAIATVQAGKLAVQAVWAQTRDAQLALQKVKQQLDMLGR